MELTVIGCWGAYPAPNEATSGYLIKRGELSILLDCGSGVLSRLQNEVPLEQLDAVFITHTHADHIADALTLEFAALVLMQTGKRSKPLDVYVYGEDPDKLGFQFPECVRVHPIDLRQKVQIGELTLEFSENVHEVPCCAVKVTAADGKTLVYSSDTGYCDSIVEFSRQADVLVLESSFYDWQKGAMRGHLTAGEAGEIAALAKPGQLVLTHFPHYGDLRQLEAEASSRFDGQTRLAFGGMKLNI